MYNIAPLVLILISLSVVIITIVRKFSILANLDVDNMPAEKEARVKEQIIGKRLKRNIIKWNAKLIIFVKFLFEKLNIFSKWIYKKLIDIKDHCKNEELERKPQDKKKNIEELLVDVEDLLQKEEKEGAEKKLIKIIGLDSKNLIAFKILANFYFEGGQHNEAKQTYEHILKLMQEVESEESEAEIYYNIALIEKDRDIIDESIMYFKKALEREPNNPRYLDILLETSIINKDKNSATVAFKQLSETNPENQKLKDFKEQIDKL
jgi:tetratricopeptide (TPR) repeat protein